MKWIAIALGVLCLALASAIVLKPEERLRVGGENIEGDYSAIVHLRANERHTIRVDVYADFTCPACQRLENDGLARLERSFGNALVIRKHYLAGPATAPAAKVLYDIAAERGKGKPVATALFQAKLAHGQDKKNLPKVRAIAKQHGLAKDFESRFADGSGIARARAEWASKGGYIAFFPFVVIDNDIAANGDVENLETLLASLLAKVPGRTSPQ